MVKKKTRVIVGMSGGVDSSMAAMLLKKMGYSPIGVSLHYCVWRNSANRLRENICCSRQAFKTAKKVCRKIGIPHDVVYVGRQFKEVVMKYFVEAFQKGETPNPCVICNRYLKFPALLGVAKEHGADYVATGHYARIRENKKTESFELLMAKDRIKDQSYFLCLLNQKMLKRIIFPLAEKTKREVLRMAKDLGFEEFNKKRESQDLCFVSKEAIGLFLKQFLGERKGEIKDIKGNVLGEHRGVYNFTIGQRKGLKLSGGPWYVVGFDKNDVVVARDHDSPLLYRREVILKDFNLISRNWQEEEIKGRAKIRSTQPLEKAKLVLKNKKAKIVFEKKVRAATPGQFGVFYSPRRTGQEDVCFGGGEIKGF